MCYVVLLIYWMILCFRRVFMLMNRRIVIGDILQFHQNVYSFYERVSQLTMFTSKCYTRLSRQ